MSKLYHTWYMTSINLWNIRTISMDFQYYIANEYHPYARYEEHIGRPPVGRYYASEQRSHHVS